MRSEGADDPLHPIVRLNGLGDATLILARAPSVDELLVAVPEIGRILEHSLRMNRRCSTPVYLRWYLGDLRDWRGFWVGRYCDFVHSRGYGWMLRQIAWEQDRGERTGLDAAIACRQSRRRAGVPSFGWDHLRRLFWELVRRFSEDHLRTFTQRYEQLASEVLQFEGPVGCPSGYWYDGEFWVEVERLQIPRDEAAAFVLERRLRDRLGDADEAAYCELLRQKHPGLREALRRDLRQGDWVEFLGRFPDMAELLVDSALESEGPSER